MERWFLGSVVLPDRVLAQGLVQVAGGRIQGVWDLNSGPPPPTDAGRVETAAFIAPGFIDLHVHGGNGADFMDGTAEASACVAAAHARHGTTGMMATTMAAPRRRRFCGLSGPL